MAELSTGNASPIAPMDTFGDTPAGGGALENSAASSLPTRFYGAWWAMFAGDALAMPGHGYYNRDFLRRDYGTLNYYQPPRHPHPESSLFRTHYQHETSRGNILHDRAPAWRRPGTHFHHQLEAGENTLMLQLARELADSVGEAGRYPSAVHTQRFLDFMLTPGRHRDTYVPENLREFFSRLDRGREPEQCGVESQHLAGVALTVPLMLFYCHSRHTGAKAVREALHLTHRGEPVARAAELIYEIMAHLLQGWPMGFTLIERIGRDRHPALAYPYRRWIESNRPEEDIASKELSSGPHVDTALPLVIYLALKYGGDTENGLVANAMLGGDSCHRGAVLGALLGAANGCEGLPGEWVEGLFLREPLEQTVDKLWAAAKF